MKMKSFKSRKGLRWLIGLMTVSLIGITGIQAYWISNSYDIKEEKFDQEVGAAMIGVSRRLEMLESVNLLFDSFRLQPFFSAQARSNFGFHGDRDSLDDQRRRESRFQFSMWVNGDTVEIYNTDSSKLEIKGQLGVDSNPRIYLQNLTSRMEKRVRDMEAVYQKLFLHEMRKHYPLEKRLTREDLDSILHFEFVSRGIDIPFEFAVIENNRLAMKSQGWDPGREQHRAALFPNDFFGNRFLMVSFPGKANYLLSSMWFTLVISMLFTLAMILTFSRTLSYSIRQKRISEIKTDFINNMTHEFKTPIATINLAIDALSNEKVIGNPEKIKHYSSVIRQENQRMNMQVESVLRMALMDKKELDLNVQETEVQEILNDCAEHVKLQLEARDGFLHRFFNDPHIRLKLDQNHFGNAVINILDNAIKYSVGSPEIKMVTEVTRNNFILIISDKGIGMTKEEQKRIFDRFFRVSSGDIHNIKGHGLGLSYAQGIIEAHGGRIEVESEKGKGSKFYIYLPLNNEDQD